MRKSIDTYVQSIASDNKQFILEGGYESVADYIISNATTALPITNILMIQNLMNQESQLRNRLMS